MFFKSLNLQFFITFIKFYKVFTYHIIIFLFFCLDDSPIMDSATQTNCGDCNNNITSATAPQAKT